MRQANTGGQKLAQKDEQRNTKDTQSTPNEDQEQKQK